MRPSGTEPEPASVERVPFKCAACKQAVLAPVSLAGVTQACPKCRKVVLWKSPLAARQKQPFLLLRAIGGGALLAFGAWVFLAALTDGKERTDREVLRVVFWGFLFATSGASLIASYRTGELSRLVASLNPLQGRPASVVYRRLGPPAVTVREGEDEFSTWGSPGYTVTLKFRDGTCVGVVREVTTSS